MYKLLLLDIDGTLRDEYAGIPQSTSRAIALCQKNNCRVVICTGRSLGTIQEDVKAQAVDGYICGGGCHIIYHNKTLCDVSLPKHKIQQVVQIVQDKNIAFALESRDTVFMNQGAKEIFEQMNKTKRKHKNVNKQFIQDTIVYENNMHMFHGQAIHKICLWSTKEIFEEIQQVLGKHMELAQHDAYKDLLYYEIIQHGYHKGNAVERLQAFLQIHKEETICFGDGDNDIAMFKACGCAIAMKHSHKRLQQCATSICEDVCEDGIYLELKRRNIL